MKKYTASRYKSLYGNAKGKVVASNTCVVISKKGGDSQKINNDSEKNSK